MKFECLYYRSKNLNLKKNRLRIRKERNVITGEYTPFPTDMSSFLYFTFLFFF